MARRIEKERLKARTRRACIEMTRGMNKAQLAKRLDDVKAKLKASTDREGRPMPGFADRAAACAEEIARLETEIAR